MGGMVFTVGVLCITVAALFVLAILGSQRLEKLEREVEELRLAERTRTSPMLKRIP